MDRHSEKRLIDADALAEQVDNLCSDWNENWIGNDNQSFILHSDVSDLISDAPTVDAVEVVHGEWIMCEDENDCEYIECPLCGEQFYDGDNDTFDKPWNYCPNCGAKMDENENP